MFQLIFLCINFLLCSIKLCRVLEKIVVLSNCVLSSKRLLCSRKNCSVLQKIVPFRQIVFCSRKDCCVLKKIIVFLNWNCVVFCPYGPPYVTDIDHEDKDKVNVPSSNKFVFNPRSYHSCLCSFLCIKS